MGRSSIEGWGINDAPYDVVKTALVGGKRQHIWKCPYYSKWVGVIKRCRSAYEHNIRPSYTGCKVAEDWQYFSNFHKWVDEQPNRKWESCHLDKDLLVNGNKIYSPDTCVFIPFGLNIFLTDSYNSRGLYALGTCWHKVSNRFISRCSNPFNVGQNYIGIFHTELAAHKAWQAKKHEYACMLADLQEDPRVADALRQRYAPDKDWSQQ